MIKFNNEVQYDNSFFCDSSRFLASFSFEGRKILCWLPSGLDENSGIFLKLHRIWFSSESKQTSRGLNFEDLKENKTLQQKIYSHLYIRIFGI